MQVARAKRTGILISLTPLVDVLLILLVFFMVTSSYLDLDMTPLAKGGDDAAPQIATSTEGGSSLLIRLGADGNIRLRGSEIAASALVDALRIEIAARPELRVMVMPSPAASTQALVTTLDAARRAGAADVQVVRLGGGG